MKLAVCYSGLFFSVVNESKRLVKTCVFLFSLVEVMGGVWRHAGRLHNNATNPSCARQPNES